MVVSAQGLRATTSIRTRLDNRNLKCVLWNYAHALLFLIRWICQYVSYSEKLLLTISSIHLSHDIHQYTYSGNQCTSLILSECQRKNNKSARDGMNTHEKKKPEQIERNKKEMHWSNSSARKIFPRLFFRHFSPDQALLGIFIAIGAFSSSICVIYGAVQQRVLS